MPKKCKKGPTKVERRGKGGRGDKLQKVEGAKGVKGEKRQQRKQRNIAAKRDEENGGQREKSFCLLVPDNTQRSRFSPPLRCETEIGETLVFIY